MGLDLTTPEIKGQTLTPLSHTGAPGVVFSSRSFLACGCGQDRVPGFSPSRFVSRQQYAGSTVLTLLSTGLQGASKAGYMGLRT